MFRKFYPASTKNFFAKLAIKNPYMSWKGSVDLISEC